jgi:hypothetical protein
MTPSTPDPGADNTGKVLTRRPQARGRTAVMLTYAPYEAAQLRALADSIRIKGDKKPTLSTIARRALTVYCHVYEARPAEERAAIEKLVTQVPQPATYSKKAKSQ